jgi:cytochrome c oxidase subunit 1/cytochrome c oxidase subunit I+III
MWDQPELHGGKQGISLAGGHLTLSTSMLDATPQAIVHMPHESPWPFALTVALMALFAGLLLDSLPLEVAGVAGTLAGLTGWFWPKGETQET